MIQDIRFIENYVYGFIYNRIGLHSVIWQYTFKMTGGKLINDTFF